MHLFLAMSVSADLLYTEAKFINRRNDNRYASFVYYFRPISTLFIDVTSDTFITLVPASDCHSEINNLKSEPNHKNT